MNNQPATDYIAEVPGYPSCMDFCHTDSDGHLWQFSEAKNDGGMPTYTRIVTRCGGDEVGLTPYQLVVCKRFVVSHKRTYTFQYKKTGDHDGNGNYIYPICDPKQDGFACGTSLITDFKESFNIFLKHHKLMTGDC